MLSFDFSIQKLADLKTQPSTVNWDEPHKSQHLEDELSAASSASSSSKTIIGCWGCRTPGRIFWGAISKNQKKNRFFVVSFDFFLSYWFFYFDASSSKTLWRHWQCRRGPPRHLFWGNNENIYFKICPDFSIFFFI